MTVPGPWRDEAGPRNSLQVSAELIGHATVSSSFHLPLLPPLRSWATPPRSVLLVSTPRWRRPASIQLSTTQTRRIHVPWRLCVTRWSSKNLASCFLRAVLIRSDIISINWIVETPWHVISRIFVEVIDAENGRCRRNDVVRRSGCPLALCANSKTQNGCQWMDGEILLPVNRFLFLVTSERCFFMFKSMLWWNLYDVNTGWRTQEHS